MRTSDASRTHEFSPVVQQIACSPDRAHCTSDTRHSGIIASANASVGFMNRFAIVTSIALLVGGSASTAAAQTETDPESCFCSVNNSGQGIYWAEVLGGEQVEIVQIVRTDSSLPDPDQLVVTGLSEPAGAEILVSGNDYLLLNSDGTVSCPGRFCGSSYRISRSDAERLAESANCISDLSTVAINGVEPVCATSGEMLCSAAPRSGNPTTLIAMLAALGILGAQRKRAASRATHIS